MKGGRALDRGREEDNTGRTRLQPSRALCFMKGYYRAPDETAAAIDAEGWFNTRDLARFEDENLFIVGRTKDLIIRFGFNVYPAEVEAVLNANPAVAQSAVVGRTTDGDEEILAFVQPSPGSLLTETDLAE
jgi:long-chain acyl-CoA synthetase